jgi:flavin reductase (NADH)
MADLSQQQLDFRNAMAQLPAAVNIITTNGPGGRCGITASAVCSVTDSPPTVLVCVNRNSATHDVFRTNGHLCVNVLCGEQEELARHFAGMTQVPMAGVLPGTRGTTAVPKARCPGAAGRADQRVQKEVHSVMFVELTKVGVREPRDSLVYFNRLFHRVQHASAA